MADLPPPPPAEAPAAVVAPAPAAAELIYVDTPEYRYSVAGNTLLPREKVEAAIRSGKTPKEALDALNSAYVQAGYFLVVIGGRVSDKLVGFQVLQGRITEIDAPPDLVPFARRVMDRDDVTRDELVRDSTLLEQYSARQGKRPKAAFSPAQAMGGTKVTITEEEIPGAKPWGAGLSFSNFSGRFSSRYTAGGNVTVRPGGGLELTASYNQGIPGLTSESSGSTYRSGAIGGTVVTPWGIYGLSFSDTQYQIGEAAAPAYPAGFTEFASLTGVQLVYASTSSRLVVNEALTRYNNNQSVFEGLFDTVDQRYTVATVGTTYTQTFVLAGQNSSFSAGVTVAKGLSAPSGTFLPRDPGIPDPRFFLIQANGTVATGLPGGFTASAQLTLQQTDVTLPQAQQWVLGGYGNLTAWLPATLIADSGALLRATVATPAWQSGIFSLSGGAFAEAGIGRLEQRGIGEPKTRSLGDVGLTVTGSTTMGTSLSLAYAWPVWYRNVDGVIRDAVDRNRANLYFSLNQTF